MLGYAGSLVGVAVVQAVSMERKDVPEPWVTWLKRHNICRPAVSSEVGGREKTLEGVRCPCLSQFLKLIASARGGRAGRPRRR